MSRRVALVTGGTRGIGLGIARALAGEFDVAICGRREEGAVAAVVEELGRAGAAVVARALALLDEVEVQAVGALGEQGFHPQGHYSKLWGAKTPLILCQRQGVG